MAVDAKGRVVVLSHLIVAQCEVNGASEQASSKRLTGESISGDDVELKWHQLLLSLGEAGQ